MALVRGVINWLPKLNAAENRLVPVCDRDGFNVLDLIVTLSVGTILTSHSPYIPGGEIYGRNM